MALLPGEWLLTCESKSYWCPPTPVRVVAGRTRSIALAIFDGTEAKVPIANGGFKGEVRVEGETQSQHRIAALGHVEHQVLTVFLPRTRLNLKIAAPGYSPVFRWGVRPEDLEQVGVRFSVGASVSGFLIDAATGRRLPGIQVALLSPILGQRLNEKTTSSGFFQFAGLQAGNYSLQRVPASGGPWSISSNFPVDGTADAFLGEVSATPPVSLVVNLTPNLAPGLAPWAITLRRKGGLVDADRQPLRRSADKSGRIMFAGLLPGDYQIAVGSGKDTFMTEDVSAVTDSVLGLDVPLSKVVGTVFRNQQPVVGARIHLFAGQNDSMEVVSGEEGEFSGTMRRPFFGKLMAIVEARDGWEAFTEVKDVDLDRNPLEVNLRFGDASIRGTVVDSSGRPKAGAAVTLNALSAPRLSTESDRNGNFRFEALDPGMYEVFARIRPQPSSEAVSVQIADANAVQEVAISLPAARGLRVSVRAIDGQPLRGSRVFSYFPGFPTSIGSNGLHSIVSLNGSFDLEIPETARTGLFMVRGPGHPLWAGCRMVTAPEGQLPEVRLVVPPPQGGTVRFESIPEAGRQSIGGSLALVSDAGWALPFGTAITTSQSIGNKRIDVTGPIAPGRYAYVQVPMTFAEYATGLCSGTMSIPSDAQWFSVEPGGETLVIQEPARLVR
jgi:hypothetical protein